MTPFGSRSAAVVTLRKGNLGLGINGPRFEEKESLSGIALGVAWVAKRTVGVIM